MITGKQIKMARAYYDMSQSQFSEAIGCTREMIILFENAKIPTEYGRFEAEIIGYCRDLTFVYGGVVEKMQFIGEKKPVKFRPHRGSLAAAMAEVREYYTRADFIRWLTEDMAVYDFKVDASKVHIQPYGYDDRIGWNTYIVTLDGYGVVGFTNGPLEK